MRREPYYAIVHADGKVGFDYPTREQAEWALKFFATDHFGPGPVCSQCGCFVNPPRENRYKTARIVEYIREWAD